MVNSNASIAEGSTTNGIPTRSPTGAFVKSVKTNWHLLALSSKSGHAAMQFREYE